MVQFCYLRLYLGPLHMTRLKGLAGPVTATYFALGSYEKFQPGFWDQKRAKILGTSSGAKFKKRSKRREIQKFWLSRSLLTEIPIGKTEISGTELARPLIWRHRKFYKWLSGKARSRKRGQPGQTGSCEEALSHWICFLLSFASDSKNAHALKLE